MKFDKPNISWPRNHQTLVTVTIWEWKNGKICYKIKLIYKMRLMFENNLITMQLLSALKIIESLITVEFSLIFQLFIGKRFPFSSCWCLWYGHEHENRPNLFLKQIETNYFWTSVICKQTSEMFCWELKLNVPWSFSR